MECVQGERGNVYVKDGFIYTQNKVFDGVRYFKCVKDECSSRASIALDQNDFKCSSHNHKPDQTSIDLYHLRAELKRQATKSSRSIRQIYDDVCGRFPEAAKRISFLSVRTTIYRYRRLGGIPVRQYVPGKAKSRDVQRKAANNIRRRRCLQNGIQDQKTVEGNDSENYGHPSVQQPSSSTSRAEVRVDQPFPKKLKQSEAIARQNELLEIVCSNLEKNSDKQQPNIPLIAVAWGEKLLQLKPQQRELAEKIINDVLFDASQGTLRRRR